MTLSLKKQTKKKKLYVEIHTFCNIPVSFQLQVKQDKAAFRVKANTSSTNTVTLEKLVLTALMYNALWICNPKSSC